MSRPYYDDTGVHREPTDAEMLEIIRKALHPEKPNRPQIERETIPSHVKHSVKHSDKKDEGQKMIDAHLEPKFIAAYKRMANECHYRPKAPADQLTGQITVPLEELDLEDEARRWAAYWLTTGEKELAYTVGLADGHDRATLAVVAEAGRCMCGMATRISRDLLNLAADMLTQAWPAERFR